MTEYQLLQQACADYLSHKYQDTAPKAISVPSTINWNRLLKLARVHRVRPILYDTVTRGRLDMPTDVRSRLQQQCRSISMHNLQLFQELKKIQKELRQNNIDHLTLKGPYLAEELFNDVGMRETSDIDLLIHEQSFQRSSKAFSKIGYISRNNYPQSLRAWYRYHNCEYGFIKKEDNKTYKIDLHWFIRPRMIQATVSLSDIQQAQGTDKEYISPEMLLITLSIHHGCDRCERLKQVVDIAALLLAYQNTINWKKVVSIAEQWQVKNLVLFCIGQSAEAFGITITHEIQQDVNKHFNKKRTGLYALQRASLGGKSDYLQSKLRRFGFHFLIRQKTTTKIKMAFHILFYHLGFRIFWYKKIKN